MAKFPSREWADSFCSALNRSSEYKSTAAKWEGDIVFLAINIPLDVGVGAVAAMKFYLKHGMCLGYEFYPGDSAQLADAPYILEADYRTWLDVIAGRLQPIPAMLLGKIRVKRGSLAVLAQYAPAALAMIKTAQEVGV
ncbi:MAG: Fis family transcriptional regulator [Thermoproteus sp.]